MERECSTSLKTARGQIKKSIRYYTAIQHTHKINFYVYLQRNRRITRAKSIQQAKEQVHLVEKRSQCLFNYTTLKWTALVLRPIRWVQKNFFEVRQSVEWGYGEVVREFALLDFRKNIKRSSFKTSVICILLEHCLQII